MKAANYKLETTAGPIVVPADDLSDDARWAYRNGQCHAMALAMHELTGWQVVGLYYDASLPSHCVVEDPDGELWDVDGPGARERWNHTHPGPLTPEAIEAGLYSEEEGIRYKPLCKRAAKHFAKKVLDKHGIAW